MVGGGTGPVTWSAGWEGLGAGVCPKCRHVEGVLHVREELRVNRTMPACACQFLVSMLGPSETPLGNTLVRPKCPIRIPVCVPTCISTASLGKSHLRI